MGVIDISAIIADAASTYVSTDECRYALNGIYVHPHPEVGAVIVATDGHRLIAIHDQAGSCSEASIIRFAKPARQALKACKNAERLLMSADGHLSITGVFGGTDDARIKADYPDYRKVLTQVVDAIKEKKSGIASFNAAYVADLEKVSKRLTGLKGQPVKIRSFDDRMQALTLWPNTPHAVGLLMPMYAGNNDAMPLFMQPVLEGKKPRVRRKAAAQ